MKLRNGYVSNSSSSSFVLSYNPEIGNLLHAINHDFFEYGTSFCDFEYEEVFENEAEYYGEAIGDPERDAYVARYNADKAEFMKMVEDEKKQGRTKIISGEIDYHEDVAFRMLEFLSKSSDKFKVIYKSEC